MSEPATRLARRLDLSDAIILGMGSMIGAGIFASAGPAAAAAGDGLLLALVLAALVALLNAMTMAQLAAKFPESGGAYVYGRNMLGPFWGFLAGWGFVVGKTASCTAMALTFGHYLYPANPRLLAIFGVVTVTAINLRGISKTATATKLILVFVLLCLAAAVASAWLGPSPTFSIIGEWREWRPKGILEATGMMFFAFAGYARIATLGEEVIHPRQTIPRAILGALTITLTVYFMVIATLALHLGATTTAASAAPLAALVEASRFPALSPLVRMGAAAASVGVLLSLLAGVSRTVFAMAANRELPKPLAQVHATRRTPWIAELTLSVVVVGIVLMADTRLAIGFSSFAVLTYYAIANLCAWRLEGPDRLWPKWISILGLIACLVVAFSLPLKAVGGGVLLFLLGAAIYWIPLHSNATLRR
jgi:APA family basic amino acid/polyamine antiporter